MQYGDKLYKPISDEDYLAASDWCSNNYGMIVDYSEYVEIVRVPVPEITYENYDSAMEAYIKEVCVERDYTTREPSAYLGDPNPRWNQDAIDFIDFRSRVMTYAFEVKNKFIAGEPIPTLAEFEAHLRTIKCNWTYAAIE